MTFWQLTYAALLLTATAIAVTDNRSCRWLLLFVMWANFAATMALAFNPVLVAIADIVAASLLTMRGKREGAVAVLFALMVPVYVAAERLSIPNYATYTVIDVIAYVQIIVVGWPDGGFTRFIHARRRRGPSVGGSDRAAGQSARHIQE